MAVTFVVAEDVKRVVIDKGLSRESLDDYVGKLSKLYETARAWVRMADTIIDAVKGKSVAEIVRDDPVVSSLLFGGLGSSRGAYRVGEAMVATGINEYKLREALEKGLGLEDINDVRVGEPKYTTFTEYVIDLAQAALNALKELRGKLSEPPEVEPEPQTAARTLAELVAKALEVLPGIHLLPTALQAFRLISPSFASRRLGVKVPDDSRLKDLGVELKEGINNPRDPSSSIYVPSEKSLVRIVDKVSCHAYTIVSSLSSGIGSLINVRVSYTDMAISPYSNLLKKFWDSFKGVDRGEYSAREPLPCLAWGIHYNNVTFYKVYTMAIELSGPTARLGGRMFEACDITDALSTMSVAGLAFAIPEYSSVVVVGG